MESFHLSFSLNSHFSDHVVFGKPALSAATLIVELANVIEEKFEVDSVMFEDLFFLEIVFFETLQVDLEGSLDLIKSTLSVKNGDKTIIAGKFQISPKKCPNLNHFEVRVDSTSKSEFYHELLDFGYEHRGSFQSIQQVHLADGKGKVQLNGEIDAVLDGVLQAMVLDKVKRQPLEKEELMVPFNFKKIFHHKNGGKNERFNSRFVENDFDLLFDKKMVVFGRGISFKQICRPKKNTGIMIRSAACRLPGGVRSLQDLADLLFEGRTTDRRIPAQRMAERNEFLQGNFGKMLEGANFLDDSLAEFDPSFFGINKLEAKAMDPQQRLLLEVVWECLENAGIKNCKETGFFVGQMGCEYAELDADTEKPSALGMIGAANSVLAGRLNYVFDSMGPSEAIDTACSSSLVALQHAVDSIRLGRCKNAVVAGCSLILSKNGLAQRISGNLLSSDGGCKTFDSDADGYGRSDGIVVIFIEEVDLEQKLNYLAEIMSIETNHGGKSAGLTVPNGTAHSVLIDQAIRNSGVKKVDYWECHGTGTALGDPIEVSALQKTLESRNLKSQTLLGSVKSNLGHCEGCAGLAGILKTIIVLNEAYTTHHPRFKLLNRNIQLCDKIVGIPIIGENLVESQRIGGVSSFGVSGTNVAVVLSSPETSKLSIIHQKIASRMLKQGIFIVPITAKSQNSLDSLVQQYTNLFSSSDQADQFLLSTAASNSRKFFKHRSALVKNEKDEMIQITAAKASEIGFDFDKSIDWNIIFRNQQIQKLFLENVRNLKIIEKNMENVLEKAKIIAVWNFFVQTGAVFKFGICSDANMKKMKINLPNFVDEPPPGSLIINSNAVPIKSIFDLNKALALIFLNQNICFKKVYNMSDNEIANLPFQNLPNYQFDRQNYWNKTVNDDFDHFFLGNVISKTDSTITLENLLVKKRIKEVFSPKAKIEAAVEVEILAGIGRLISRNGNFQINNLEFKKHLDLNALTDGCWIQTKITKDENKKYMVVICIEKQVMFEIKFVHVEFDFETSKLKTQLFQSWILGVDKVSRGLEKEGITTTKELRSVKVFNVDSIQADSTPVFHRRRICFSLDDEKTLELNFELTKPDFRRLAKTKSPQQTMPKWTLDSVTRILKQCLKEVIESEAEFSDSELLTKGFMDLGLDSLSLMGFFDEITLKHFPGIQLVSTDLFTFTTVSTLAPVIFEKLNGHHPEVQTQNLKSNKKLAPSLENMYSIIKTIPNQPRATKVKLCFDSNSPTLTFQLEDSSFCLDSQNAFDNFLKILKDSDSAEFNLNFNFGFGLPTNWINLELISLLLSFSSTISKLRRKCILSVEEITNPTSGFVAGFLKSLSVEKMNFLRFQFTEKIEKMNSSSSETEEPGGVWVITGGTSGIGFEIGKHLAEFDNIEKVYLLSRRGKIDANSTGKLIPIPIDVSKFDQVDNFFSSIQKIDGIIHSAGIIEDAIVERQTIKSFEQVLAPKFDGLRNLLQIIYKYNLKPKRIILNSSVASIFGNFGQTNYSAANAAAEQLLMEFRSKTGVGSIIHWGNWSETGMAADKQISQTLASHGFVGLKTQEGLSAMDFVIGTNEERIMVAKLDWNKIIKVRQDLQQIVQNKSQRSEFQEHNKPSLLKMASESNSVKENHTGNASKQLYSKIKKEIENELKKTLNFDANEELEEETGFMQLGLDSFMLYSLSHSLTEKFNDNSIKVPVNVIDLFENPSLQLLTDFIYKKSGQRVNGMKHIDETNQKLCATSIDLRAIEDHEIQRKIIIPAAFEIDAFLNISNKQSLKNLNFKEVLQLQDLNFAVLKKSEKQKLEIILGSKIITNCNADTEREPKKLGFAHIEMKPLISAEFYRSMGKRGVNYGRSMRLLERIRRTKNKMAALVYLDKNDPKWLLFEAGLQALSAITYDQHKNQYFIPVKIGNVSVSEEYKTQMTEKWFKLKAEITSENERFLEGAFSVSDNEKVLIEFQQIMAIKLNSENNLKKNQTTKKLLRKEEAEWEKSGQKTDSDIKIEMENHANTPNIQQLNMVKTKKEMTILLAENAKVDHQQARSKQQKCEQKNEVFVVGYECQFFGSDDIESFWNYLTSSSKVVKTCQKEGIPRSLLLSSDPAYFDPSAFSITPREAVFLDPQQRLLLQCTQRALIKAKMGKLPENTGVFVGCSSADFSNACTAEFATVSAQYSQTRGYLASGTNMSCLAGRLAHWLRTSGPALTVDTGCSSFAAALCAACDRLKSGSIETAVVGAVNFILNEENTAVLSEAGMLSKSEKCAVFDVDADGYVRAEGVAVVLLSTTTRSQIQIKGWEIGHNANSAALTVPNGNSQIKVLKSALKQAGMCQVDVVECHGSGTSIGDPIEVQSVLRTFPDADRITLTGMKAHVGHSEACAAAASFVAVCEMLKNGILPGQRNFKLLNQKIRQLDDAKKLFIPLINQETSLKTAAINSFGFSGTNVSIVLEKQQMVQQVQTQQCSKLILLLCESKALTPKLDQLRQKIAADFGFVHDLPTVSIFGKTGDLKTAVVVQMADLENPAILTPMPRKSETKLSVVLSRCEWPQMILAELLEQKPELKQGISEVWRQNPLASLLDQTEKAVFCLNLAILNLLLHFPVPVEKVILPVSFSANLRSATVTSLKLLELTTSFELESKTDSKIVAVDSIFENSTIPENCRPSTALNHFFGRLFVEGLLDLKKIPQFEDESAEKKKTKFWPLQRSSRPKWWENPKTVLAPEIDQFLFKLSDEHVDLAEFDQSLEDAVLMPLNEESEYAALKMAKKLGCLFSLKFQKSDFIVLVAVKGQNSADFAFQTCKLVANLAQNNVQRIVCVLSDRFESLESLILSIDAETQSKVASLVVDNAEDAMLRKAVVCLMTGGHVCGRLKNQDFTVRKLLPAMLDSSPKNHKFSKILITGGNGGIGRMILEAFDAECFVVVSRTAKPEKNGPVKVYRGNVADWNFLESVFEQQKNIDAIFHCAGTVDNSQARSLTKEQFLKVAESKVDGTKNLLKLAQKTKSVKLFVAMSSVATVFGSFGQANYSWANSEMEKLVQTADGDFKKLAICWGPLEDVGMLAGPKMEPIRKQICEGGWKMIDKTTVEAVLKRIQNETGKIVVFNGNFETILDQRKSLATLMEHLAKHDKNKQQKIRKTMRTLPKKAIVKKLTKFVSEISGLETVEEKTGLMSLGMDSLMIEQLRTTIQGHFDLKMTPAEMFANPNIQLLSDFIEKNCQKFVETESNQEKLAEPCKLEEKVAIVGFSGTFPGSETAEEFLDALFDGKKLVDSTGMFDAEVLETFDFPFFNLSFQDAKMMDPQIRLLLCHAYLVLERTGHVLDDKSLIGCFCASEPSFHEPRNGAETDFLTKLYLKNQHSFAASWLSHLLDLKGPSMNVYTACSSSIVAINQAVECLLQKNADLCLVGASHVLLSTGNLQGMALSKEGNCLPFDQDATGIVPGSFAGVLLLKRLSEAAEDEILATIEGIGISNDGFNKANFMAPGQEGQILAMKRALANAKVDASEIGYLECHATGTAIGDQMEINSIVQVFKEFKNNQKKLKIGSVKANVGHCFAGAGMVGIVKCLAAMQRREIPKQINLKRKLPEITLSGFLKICQENQRIDDEYFAVNAFGIGGTDACVVLKRFDNKPKFSTKTTKFCVVPISGKTPEACLKNSLALAEYLETKTCDLGNVCWTLQHCRPHFDHRMAVLAQTKESAVEKLKTAVEMQNVVKSEVLEPENVAFFFAPQGIQFAGMLTPEDFEHSPKMKQRFDKLSQIASEEFGQDFSRIQASQNLVELPEFAQVTLFITLIVVAEALEDFGIVPETVLGHSVGEYAAFCLAGSLSAENTVRLLARRSKVMAKTSKAKMLSFKDPFGIVKSLPKNVEISAFLSEKIKAAVGPPEAVDEFAAKLKELGIDFRFLKTSKGFHSSMMDPILPEFERIIRQFHFKTPNKKVISNLHGAFIDDVDDDYFAKHLRNPVRIDKSLDSLLKNNKIKTIVEVGPPGLLVNLLLQRGRPDIRVVRTIQTKDQAKNQPRSFPVVLEVAAEMWKNGFGIKWPEHGQKVFDLPGYCFDRIKLSGLETAEKPKLPPKKQEKLILEADETKMKRIWTECLATSETLSETSNFFDFGGNSLNGVQLCWKIEEEFGFSVNVSTLFDFPVFFEFCQQVFSKNEVVEVNRIQPMSSAESEDKEFPLSLPQEQMFLLYHLEPGNHYNIVFSIKFTGNFSTKVANQALIELVRQQASLRTVFGMKNGQGFQKIKPVENAIFDLSWKPTDESGFKKAVEEEKAFNFKISESAFRLRSFRISEDHLLLISQHHIVTDGWSMTVFADELSNLYSTILAGKLPTKSARIQYVDFALANRKTLDEEKMKNWAKKLASFDPSNLFSRNPVKNKSFIAESTNFIFPKKLIDNLKQISKEFSVSFYSALLVCFLRTLAIWTEHQDSSCLMIGLASSGRLIPESKGLIGYFLNNLICAVANKALLFSDNLGDVFASVKQSLNEALDHQQIPYHRLLSEWRKAKDTDEELFHVYFNYRSNLDFPSVQIPEVESTVTQETNNRVFDFSVTVDEIGQTTRLLIDWRTDLFDKEMVHSFAEDLMEEMENLGKNGNKIELSQQNVEQTPTPTVISLILEQCDKFPDNLAIVGPHGTEMTYSQLKNAILSKCHALKAFLQCFTQQKPEILPICLDFNEQIEWFLACQAAGMAYCPMDPENADSINEEILNQIGCKVAISRKQFNSKTISISPEVIVNFSTFEVDLEAKGPELLYVMFTSGSTGFPKGVMIENSQVFNFLAAAKADLKVTERSTLAHSVNIIFDVSVFNIYAALTSGACLKQFESLRSVVEISAKSDDLSHLFLTSAVFNSLSPKTLQQLSCLKNLKHLIVGGETPSEAAILCFKNSAVKVTQIYGPTEATVWATLKKYERFEDLDSAIIGKEISGTNAAIVAQNRILKPKCAAVGEIYLFGNIGRGYLSKINEDQPQFKVIKNPKNGTFKRAFATGDFGKRLENGEILFVGRKKGFLKHQGSRIDPVFVANKIKAAGNLAECVVSQEKTKNGKPVLVVFIVGNFDEKSLKTSLEKTLGQKLMPEKFVKLDKMPINLNGKLDKKKLSQIFRESVQVHEKLEVLTSESKKLEKVWKKVLHLPDSASFDENSNFFHCGGSSLAFFDLQSTIFDQFHVEIPIDVLYANSTFVSQLKILNQTSEMPKNSLPAQIVELCRKKSAKANVYCIHAIGGTVYPFYPFIHVLDDDFNLFAIPFDSNYAVDSIDDLAHFYAKKILEHSMGEPVVLVGYSLGGMLAHSMARFFLDSGLVQQDKIQVVMFDSWTMGTNQLNLDSIKSYLEKQFSSFPNSQDLLDSALKLSKFLTKHEFRFHPKINISLFKASKLTDSALKHAILPTLTDELMISIIDNGWSSFSNQIDTVLVPGDHDSIVKLENLQTIRKELNSALNQSLIAF